MNRSFILLCTFVLVLAACQATSPSMDEQIEEAPPKSGAEPAFFSDTRGDVPAEVFELRTTSGAIYLNNVNGRIAALERAVETRGDAPALRMLLANTLQHRGRLLNDTENLEQALRQVNIVLEREPENANALVTRAGLYAGFHRFQDALADLDSAARAGAAQQQLDMTRAGVLIALGQIAKAEALAEPWLEENLVDLAFQANRRVDEGKLRAADRLFSKAQAVYDKTNPATLAWLHLQHGVAFLRNQKLQRAHEFFTAAHERFPQYYLATEHLAETEYLLGNYERAAELYQQVSQQTDNPVFYAKLAKTERALGNDDAAARAEAEARAGFEAWLDRHPEAAWQHAAEYYLSREEAGTAVALARFNAKLRQNIPGLLLLARAERAVGNEGAACDAWRRTLTSAEANGLNPPEIAQSRESFEYCG